MNILEYYNIKSELLEKYVNEANASYEPYLFSTENILKILNSAKFLDNEIKECYVNFLDKIDDNLRSYLYLLYYTLFKTSEDFTFNYHGPVHQLPEPEFYKTNYLGMVKGILYIVSSTELYNFVIDNNLDILMYDRYFEKFTYFSNQNKFLHNTYGIVDCDGFLYGYSKAFLMWIGNLTFQIVKYNPYCEVYENNNGEKLFVATNKFKYNNLGLPTIEEQAFTPSQEIKGDYLFGNVFLPNGRLDLQTSKISLNEYKKILIPGDNVVTVHIPAGKSLNIEECKKSIKQAKEIFMRFFDNIKAVVCLTWFICPEIRSLLKEGGNMQKFADLFDIITISEDTHYHHLYLHIFEKSQDIPLNKLEPKNDFQRRFLDLALRGEKMYKAYGLLKENI